MLDTKSLNRARAVLYILLCIHPRYLSHWTVLLKPCYGSKRSLLHTHALMLIEAIVKVRRSLNIGRTRLSSPASPYIRIYPNPLTHNRHLTWWTQFMLCYLFLVVHIPYRMSVWNKDIKALGAGGMTKVRILQTLSCILNIQWESSQFCVHHAMVEGGGGGTFRKNLHTFIWTFLIGSRALTPSLPQPVKFPGWKMHAHACKLYLFRSYNKSLPIMCFLIKNPCTC